MSARPLRILLVVADRRWSRHLSRFLNAFGYEVQQVADLERAAAVLETDPPEILLADLDTSGGVLGLVRRANEQPRGRPIHTLLTCRPNAEAVQEALVAGADDFLSKPLVYGELLTRLRLAARRLELARRLHSRSPVCTLTGLATQAAWLARWEEALAAGQCGSAVCVLVDVDLLGSINARYGRPAGDAVLAAAAVKLRERCLPDDRVAHFGAGRFALLRPAGTLPEAAAWAEQLRGVMADTAVASGPLAIRWSASFGLAAALPEGDSPEQLLHRAEEALNGAKHSGRNCVVAHGELDDDARAWAELATPGKLFEGTLARHVMTPCTVLLAAAWPLGRALGLVRQTPWKTLPVVDADGKLIGLLDDKASGGPSAKVADALHADPPRFDEDARFTDLLAHLRQHPARLVVIVRDDRPVGLVTTSSLAVLGKPLNSETFAPGVLSPASPEFVRVPDVPATAS